MNTSADMVLQGSPNSHNSPAKTIVPAGTVSAAELEGLVEVLKGNVALEAGQRGLLDIANAAVAVLTSREGERWDALAKLEQQLAMLSSDGDTLATICASSAFNAVVCQRALQSLVPKPSFLGD